MNKGGQGNVPQD